MILSLNTPDMVLGFKPKAGLLVLKDNSNALAVFILQEIFQVSDLKLVMRKQPDKFKLWARSGSAHLQCQHAGG